MVAFVRFFIVFSSLALIITNGDERPCTFFRPLGILDCVGRGLRHVPILQDGRRDVKVLDLRQNNISAIGSEVLTIYPNLKIVDLRHNPRICGKINLVGVTIKSDCPVLITSSKPSLSPIQNTPQSSSSKAPPISVITSCIAPESSFSKASILSILSHSSIKNISRPSTIPATRSSTAKVFSTPLTLISRSSPAISTPRLSTAKPLGTPPTPVITSLYISLISAVITKTYSKSNHNSILSTILSTPATSTRFNKPTVPNATSQPRSYDLLIYLSTSISTILILMICVKFKLYTRCRQNSHESEQNAETVNMSPTSMSSSGSSTDVYSTTSV